MSSDRARGVTKDSFKLLRSASMESDSVYYDCADGGVLDENGSPNLTAHRASMIRSVF